MIERENKLAKFFAKQDKKIQKNGYKTINEIADKKQSRIQSVKQNTNPGVNQKKVNDDTNKSEDEWEQIDMSSNIGYLPDQTDLSLSKLIDQKRIQQQKIHDLQHQKSVIENKKAEPIAKTIISEPVFIPPVVSSQPPQPEIKEEKPKVYKPGSRIRKDPKIIVNLGLLLQDESQFPTL